jgi:hypothetical protein
MANRLSLGAVFFKKPLDACTNTRCIFHAEYEVRSKRFIFTKTCFVQRDSAVLAVTKKEGPCLNVAECLSQLSEAAVNAALDGYVFDVAGTSSLSTDLEIDEKWETPISRNIQRSRNKKSTKPLKE